MKINRIASYYGDISSVGRNDGGPLYHTYCLQKLYGKKNVVHLLPKGDLGDFGVFDLHWWVDWGEDALNMADFVCPKPNVYVCSDTHLGPDYRFKKAMEFDHVFFNQLRAVEEFKAKTGRDSGWVPHAFHPMAYNRGVFNPRENRWAENSETFKKYDVCFIGHLNDLDRVMHLDRVFKEFPNFFWGIKRFHEAAEVFNRSRIVFNVSCRDDVNMRVFEALGSGSFLLTNAIPTLGHIFRDGVHLVTYKDQDDMIDKARYYLEHEDERERIAAAGYREAHSNHTYMHRVLSILDAVGADYDQNLALRLLLPAVQSGGKLEAAGVGS